MAFDLLSSYDFPHRNRGSLGLPPHIRPLTPEGTGAGVSTKPGRIHTLLGHDSVPLGPPATPRASATPPTDNAPPTLHPKTPPTDDVPPTLHSKTPPTDDAPPTPHPKTPPTDDAPPTPHPKTPPTDDAPPTPHPKIPPTDDAPPTPHPKTPPTDDAPPTPHPKTPPTDDAPPTPHPKTPPTDVAPPIHAHGTEIFINERDRRKRKRNQFCIQSVWIRQRNTSPINSKYGGPLSLHSFILCGKKKFDGRKYSSQYKFVFVCKIQDSSRDSVVVWVSGTVVGGQRTRSARRDRMGVIFQDPFSTREKGERSVPGRRYLRNPNFQHVKATRSRVGRVDRDRPRPGLRHASEAAAFSAGRTKDGYSEAPVTNLAHWGLEVTTQGRHT
ncbi:uncharacterized protein LOC134786838 [Penaeus indicus]|uniref:uncharacterized protein LOC134786838 n=1 Tax=Penaeus indicus TaxID=29960 RepID=UPI00300CFDD0